ncbi:tetratricopeptide repeat protein [Fodinicurvata fenggangensis]|uniref:tetratricopeptide repeat protein n=1 Tax=Fodinicurvata fenggangensis TaxID=1121830 RepID=UPI0004796C18|nr:hypothetical protein [Fodinicurvata fenggangensis]
MDEVITMEIVDGGGIFQYGDAHDDILEELYEALDRRDGGNVTLSEYTATLKDIAERHPHFIDAHTHLGYVLLERGKPKLALQACLRGIELGEGAIPPGFAGTIEWGFLENRPFLRAAHGAILCHLELGQRRKALALMEKVLAWNPNDNQGIRYLVGPEYLRTGETEKARTILEAEAAHYPPYHYELGLLHFREDSLVSAVTSLRRGFTANVYIAEILNGNPDPTPRDIWHGTNFAEPELAHEYVGQCRQLWLDTPEAIAFLRWLYTHPKIRAEDAALTEIGEALLSERNFEERNALLDREASALASIDDQLSRELVTEYRRMPRA